MGRAFYKWQMISSPNAFLGELYAHVNIIVLPVSSLFRLPPPTPSPGQNSQSTYMRSLTWIPDWQAISRYIHICFQFSGQSHFNHSARGSFGDSLGELDTSVGVGKQCSATSYFKYFCLLTKTIMPSRERYPSEALQWISSIVNWFFQVILAALDSLGIADNTIIFFTSGTLSKTTEDQSSRI